MSLWVVFGTAFNAIAPILIMILLGYFLRAKNFINENFIKIGNKFVFNIALPVMLMMNVYSTDSLSNISWEVVIYTAVVVTFLVLLGCFVAVVTTKVPERRGVIMQCVYRSNYAIIGFSLASALGGESAKALTAMVSAICIPLFNAFSVISLSMFVSGEKGKFSFKAILKDIVKNPLIIGVAIGIVCLLARQAQLELFDKVVFSLKEDLPFVYGPLNNISNITTPFALIVLGGQFSFSAVRGMFKEIAVGTLGRVVLAPVIGIGLAIILSTYTNLLHCGPEEYPALIALFGSPVAVSSAIMAEQMHNDGQLATQLVVWTSLCSILTIFITVCLMLPTGLLSV